MKSSLTRAITAGWTDKLLRHRTEINCNLNCVCHNIVCLLSCVNMKSAKINNTGRYCQSSRSTMMPSKGLFGESEWCLMATIGLR